MTTDQHREEPVAVKPLEWKENPYDKDGEWWYAAAPVGFVYEVYRHRSGKWRVQMRIDLPPSFSDYDTLAEGVKAAQSDYEARIRSALLPAPSPVAVEGVTEDSAYMQRVLDSMDPDDPARPEIEDYLASGTEMSSTLSIESIIDAVMELERYAPLCTISPGIGGWPIFTGMEPGNDGPWLLRGDVAKKLRTVLSAAPQPPLSTGGAE